MRQSIIQYSSGQVW